MNEGSIEDGDKSYISNKEDMLNKSFISNISAITILDNYRLDEAKDFKPDYELKK